MLKSGVTAQHVEKTHLEVKSHNNLFGKLQQIFLCVQTVIS